MSAVQLYTPPKAQFDKEWIRLVLSGDKLLVPLSDLKPVTVPNYPEVSVKALWEQYKDRKEVHRYWPPKLAEGRTLDRQYFFDVLNTFLGEELKAILDHAHSQRNDVAAVEQKQEAIVLSEQMAEDLFKYPWVSKARGKTVHLLKSSAKTVRKKPIRKKYPLLD